MQPHRSPRRFPSASDRKTQGSNGHCPKPSELIECGPIVRWEPMSDAQRAMAEAWRGSGAIFVTGPAGGGKAQPLDAVVMTTSGPVRMGDVRIGDLILTPDGKAAPVNGVFPQGELDIYRVVFDNGDVVECCKDHLWAVQAKSNWGPCSTKVVSLEHLMEAGIKTPKGRRKFSIPTAAPAAFSDRSLPLDPYLLGALLGDGGFSQDSVLITTTDSTILERVTRAVPASVVVKPCAPGDVTYRLCRRAASGSNEVSTILRKLGLMPTKSVGKFIPSEYLHAGIEQRWELLRGLLDTDGTVSHTGQPVFYSVSRKLADQVRYLVAGLGGMSWLRSKKAGYKGKDGKHVPCQDCYVVSISLPDARLCFNLERKKVLTRARTKYPSQRMIERIEFSRRAPAQCIRVDSPEHLYLTDNFVVTHNTMAAVGLALKDIAEGWAKRTKVVALRPNVVADAELGFLKGGLGEKLAPFAEPIFQAAAKCATGLPPGMLEVKSLGHARGLTFDDTVVIVDEAQNCTWRQLLLCLTRLGRGSKIVFAGDPAQCDLGPLRGPPPHPEETDLWRLASALEGVKGVAWARFPEGDCFRHPLVKRCLERLRGAGDGPPGQSQEPEPEPRA